jgi:hypothetical protein
MSLHSSSPFTVLTRLPHYVWYSRRIWMWDWSITHVSQNFFFFKIKSKGLSQIVESNMDNDLAKTPTLTVPFFLLGFFLLSLQFGLNGSWHDLTLWPTNLQLPQLTSHPLPCNFIRVLRLLRISSYFSRASMLSSHQWR